MTVPLIMVAVIMPALILLVELAASAKKDML